MIRRMKIKPHERGLLFREGEPIALLRPGVHWRVDPLLKLGLQIVSPREAWLAHKDLDLMVKAGILGTEAIVLVRRAWIGEPPRDLFERQVSVYRGYASPDASATWRADEMLVDTDGDALAARIEQTVRAAGADACNVRIHVPGIDAARVRTQITRLGQDVVPTLRDALRA